MTRSSAMRQEAATCPGRVLVVDDDPVSRRYLEFALTKNGCSVVTAEGVAAALELLAGNGCEQFDCVLTDFAMPERSGLDLLAWLRDENSCLAAIIVTANGEKDLVTDSLRGGATDFLDKPVEPDILAKTVAKAVALTTQRRHSVGVESAVRDVGATQQRLLHAHAEDGLTRVALYSRPWQEAGGDAFSQFRPVAGKSCFLLTDVSGHDLRAAYLSAYFQGVVRGMLRYTARLSEVVGELNQFILEEWNLAGAGRGQRRDIDATVAASALLLDHATQTAEVLVCGMPAPVFVEVDGRAHAVGPSGGFPLGCLPDYAAPAVLQPIRDGGGFLLWTDGLEDLAHRLKVAPLSLVFALFQSQARSQTHPALEGAADDILAAGIQLPPRAGATSEFCPLFLERCPGDGAPRIDELMGFLSRSLRMALPDLPPSAVHDILLATREAALNAFQHGSGGRAEQFVELQHSYNPGLRLLRSWVDDSGPGHNFDVAAHEALSGDDFPVAHRGLMLIRHLASRMRFERGGASIVMDFQL